MAINPVYSPIAPPGTSDQGVHAVLSAEHYPGPTVGDQIFNCISALPTGGGVVDARSLPPVGTIPAMTINKSGVTILGPIGQYTVTGEVLLSGVRAVSWLGGGQDFSTAATRFMWGGNNTDPMFQLTSSRQCTFANFSIWTSSAAPLATGIGQSPGAGGVTTNNAFRDLIITSNDNGGLGIGMRWYGAGGNNDASLIERVTVSKYTTAGYSFENAQTKAHLFLHSQCVGAGAANSLYGITTALGSQGGSFTAINMLGANNTIDFYLGPPDDTVSILGGNFENSTRFLSTVSATGTAWPVIVQGVRMSAQNVNADQKIVIFHMRGGLNFSNNNIDGAAVGQTPLLSFEPSSLDSAIIADGNLIRWGAGSVVAGSNPFVGVNGAGSLWRKRGNIITDGSGVTQTIMDTA